MSSLILRMTAPGRLKVVGLICFASWLAVFVIHHATTDSLIDEQNNVIGRDFFAFYAAGRIALQGPVDSIYDQQLQKNVQSLILAPETQQGIDYFINPASVAAAYSLFARLPYRTAFYLHTLLMLSFCIAGMWVLKPHLPTLRSCWLAAVLIGVTWMPMAYDITAGQNGPLSFMLLSVAFAATVRKNQRLAGLALGLQLFKPQHALPLLGLLLLRRQFVAVGVAAVVGGGQYLLGAWYCGWDWPLDMLAATRGYFAQMAPINQGETHIALVEVVNYSINLRLGELHAPGWLTELINVFVWAVVALIVLYLIWVWRKADPSRDDFGLYWALAVAGGLVIGPHTSYHDSALLVLSMLLLIDHHNRTGRAIGSGLRGVLIVLYLVYPLVMLSRVGKLIQFQPVFLVPVWTACWAAFAIYRPQRGPDQDSNGSHPPGSARRSQ